MKREFTATVYIFQDNKVLLLEHKKFRKWLAPGGHVEVDETPPEAAKREVLEETGLEIAFIQQENLWIDFWNAHSIERPYMCLLASSPPHPDKPPHQHIDMVYVARPIGGQLLEGGSLRWFTQEEIQALVPDEEIFAETQKVLCHLFEQKLILQGCRVAL